MKKGNRIVIFDCLDTIQGYVGAEPGKNKTFYWQRTAESYGITIEDMLAQKQPEEFLERTALLISQGGLEVRILPGAEELIKSYGDQGIRPVVMTADTPTMASLVTAPFIEMGLIQPDNVYAILSLGSKKDPEIWRKAKEIYEPSSDIVAVYEDVVQNLESAIRAYRIPGFLVRETSSGISYIKHKFYQKSSRY